MIFREEENTTNISNLEKLFKGHYKSLCNVAFNIVHDRAAAEDVVQDVFLKIWKKREELSINTSLKGYMFRSTINTALNYIENRKRNFPVYNELNEEMVGGVGKAEDHLLETELKEKLTQSINRLPGKCKQIFILSRFEEMRYAEIAEKLNISIKTVENQMGKALRRLRRYLHAYIPEETSVKSMPSNKNRVFKQN